MIRRENSLVFKENKNLNAKWRLKLEKIMTVIKLPAFRFFLHNGYVNEFIKGTDLWGENMDGKEPLDLKLSPKQREAVIKVFRDIVYAGIKTGYTLADFTRKNVMVEGNKAYLVDYQVIIEGDLNKDYIRIFQTMLDYLQISYKFDGDLKKLYERLN